MNLADIDAWRGLASGNSNGIYAMRMPALSETVRLYASSMVEDQDYSIWGGITGANSNSAAQAVVDAAALQKVSPPDGARTSPGHKDANEINFVNPPTCQ